MYIVLLYTYFFFSELISILYCILYVIIARIKENKYIFYESCSMRSAETHNRGAFIAHKRRTCMMRTRLIYAPKACAPPSPKSNFTTKQLPASEHTQHSNCLFSRRRRRTSITRTKWYMKIKYILFAYSPRSSTHKYILILSAHGMEGLMSIRVLCVCRHMPLQHMRCVYTKPHVLNIIAS